ncbi:hypothetical protein D3C75_742300 [compost metagenome]
MNLVRDHLNADLQHTLPFSAVNRENTVRRHFMYRFPVTIIVLVYTLLRGILSLGDQNTLAGRILADPRADRRIIGNVLGDNIHRTLQRQLGTLYTFVCIYIFSGLFKRKTLPALLHHPIRQRLQPFFLSHTCSCLTLLLEWTIQILHFLQLDRLHNLRMQLRRQLALLLDAADDILLPVTQIAQVAQPFLDIAQRIFIQLTGHFFTVSCDKRNGIPFIQQAYRRPYLLQADAQLLGNCRSYQFLFLPDSRILLQITGIRILCCQ